jgi:hypothetical protein
MVIGHAAAAAGVPSFGSICAFIIVRVRGALISTRLSSKTGTENRVRAVTLPLTAVPAVRRRTGLDQSVPFAAWPEAGPRLPRTRPLPARAITGGLQ